MLGWVPSPTGVLHFPALCAWAAGSGAGHCHVSPAARDGSPPGCAARSADGGHGASHTWPDGADAAIASASAARAATATRVAAVRRLR